MLHAYVEKLYIVEYMLCKVRKLLQLCSKTEFRHSLLLLI